MKNRPLYHNLMKQDEYFVRYQKYFDQLISGILRAAISRPGWNRLFA